jgi:hypothetical protein
MLDIDKQYVYNEQGEAIAVQIPLDQFQQIEHLLNTSEPQSQEELDSEQPEAELSYVNGILVIKSQGTQIPASIVDDMREERIREIGGW